MKTPDEIKKGLECCYSPVEPMLRCEECPYKGSIVCKMRLHTDALDYIQQLEANDSQVEKALQDNGFGSLEEFLQAFSQVKRERDAAVNELVGTCQVCYWEGTVKCATCHFNAEAWNAHESNWEWRGVPEKEENNG